MRILSGFLFAVIICSIHSFSLKSLLKAPLHAQCNVDWSWPTTPCKTIQDKLLNQISIWTSDDNCKNGGEKCLYKLIGQNETVIRATHETPVKHYVDDLTFKFSANGQQCSVNVRFIFKRN